MERIVVGVDGSPGSLAALRWAAAEARLRGAAVEVLHAFHVPYAGGSPVMPLMLEAEDFRECAEALLDKTVGEVDDSDLPVPIVTHAVEGPAPTVLVEAGRDASMVVVGARGHGGLTGMLIGSVSRQVSEHATVPVVVVPKTQECPESQERPESHECPESQE